MKLSELIERLRQLKEQHGDLPVYGYSGESAECFDIEDATAEGHDELLVDDVGKGVKLWPFPAVDKNRYHFVQE